MKITCLLGSPRPTGNSATVAKHFCETAEDLGSQLQTFALNELNFSGCQGCMACKTKLDKCVLEDDLTQVLDAIHKTDVLVMATPTYFGEISRPAKDILWTEHTLTSHQTILAIPIQAVFRLEKNWSLSRPQGHPEENTFADIFQRYDGIFKWYGFGDTHLIRACGVGQVDDPSSQKEAIKLAEETAEKIVSGP